MRRSHISAQYSILALALCTISACQRNDKPKFVQFRSGCFATPLQLEEDDHNQKITSFRIESQLTGQRWSEGKFQIDCTPLKFNEFGDPSPAGDSAVNEYEVRLKRIENSKHRQVFQIAFDEDFCKSRFFINLPSDEFNPAKLLICKQPGTRHGRLNEGPEIERMILLRDEQRRDQHPLDGPIAEDPLLATGLLKIGRGTFSGVTVHVNGNGEFGTYLDDTNSASAIDFGDSTSSTMMGPITETVKFIEQQTNDPHNQGRRLFMMDGVRHRKVEQDDYVEQEIHVVVGPDRSSEHRMIFREAGEIVWIARLENKGWNQFVETYQLLEDLKVANAFRRLYERVGNQFVYHCYQPNKFSCVQFNFPVDRQSLDDLLAIGHIEHLTLRTSVVSSEEPESPGHLKQLTHTTLANKQVSDSILESLSGIKTLETLRLQNGLANGEHPPVTDAGLQSLASLPNLKTLSIKSDKITDDGIMAFESLPCLTSLHISDCKISLEGAVAIAKWIPNCSLSIGRGDEFSFTISPGPTTALRIIGDVSISDFELIATMRHIQELEVPENVTDEHIRQLTKMKSLKRIIIRNNENVTNDSIRHLAKLDCLESISIHRCFNLTQGCFDDLASVKSLERVSLSASGFNQDQLKRLADMLPNCHVNRY